MESPSSASERQVCTPSLLSLPPPLSITLTLPSSFLWSLQKSSDPLSNSLRVILQEHGQSPEVYQAINKVLGVRATLSLYFFFLTSLSLSLSPAGH